MTPETSTSGPLPVPATAVASGQALAWSGRIALIASALLLAAKLVLVRRINVNWDEFLFLSQVHALIRGELSSVFQSAYTHLFTWLPFLGDEMTQILTARALMMALFAVNVVLIVRLASRWASPATVWFAPLCYLAMSPVLTHGGSFRADSLIAPLSICALVLITEPTQSRRKLIGAGLCVGAAVAVSAKAVFVLPVLLALEWATAAGASRTRHQVLERLVIMGAVAVIVAGVAFGAHAWSLPPAADADVQRFASGAARKTLLDTSFVPRWDHLRVTLLRDKASWALLAIGFFVALRRRQWAALACALSLAPLLVYRNAFPYYYVVMLAPACVLVPFAVEGLRSIASRGAPPREVGWVPIAIAVLLIFQGGVRVQWLSPDDQQQQRETIAAVHAIFPKPVPYIDHSGMIASFRKVNFFMSSWGVETYRATGKSFMREAIERYRPPLLLVNRAELDSSAYRFYYLLPEDQRLIREFYVPYWGAIHVAGAHVEVPLDGSVEARVPFPGRYRLLSPVPLIIDGVVRQSGDVVTLDGDHCQLSMADPSTQTHPMPARLAWAEAEPAPTTLPPYMPLYSGL